MTDFLISSALTEPDPELLIRRFLSVMTDPVTGVIAPELSDPASLARLTGIDQDTVGGILEQIEATSRG